MKKLLLLFFVLPTALFSMEPAIHRKKRPFCVFALSTQNVQYSQPYKNSETNTITIDAYVEKKVVGRIQFMKTAGTGKICLMKVMEPYRKLGIGFQLFKAAIQELEKAGCDTIIWDAITAPTGNIENLKSIYTHMVAKLKEELECDFICGEIKKTSDYHAIFMKLVLKKINKKIQNDTIKK